ncbi:hypothetical protein B4N89_30380 [Embleya scabrispora]|uniref:Uncharacterized protein n=1 Tax=Embleya scabrispora TaxID=159449 RepID=A0A1T3P6G2_9ACTN|nr:hypothetical protein B4N89_30380 [Embleya scabrispora]
MFAVRRSGFRRLSGEAAVGDTIRIAGAAREDRPASHRPTAGSGARERWRNERTRRWDVRDRLMCS